MLIKPLCIYILLNDYLKSCGRSLLSFGIGFSTTLSFNLTVLLLKDFLFNINGSFSAGTGLFWIFNCSLLSWYKIVSSTICSGMILDLSFCTTGSFSTFCLMGDWGFIWFWLSSTPFDGKWS